MIKSLKKEIIFFIISNIKKPITVLQKKSKRAAERLLWQKFEIFSGVRLVRSAGSLYDMRTNPGEANGFLKIQPTYFL